MVLIVVLSSCSSQKEPQFVYKYNVHIHAEEEVIDDTVYVTRMYADHITDSTYFKMIGHIEDNIQVIILMETITSSGAHVIYKFAYPQNREQYLYVLALLLKESLLSKEDIEPILETVLLLEEAANELSRKTF